MSARCIAAVEKQATFEWGSDSRFSVFPGADYGNEISRVEDANPVQIQGGYDKISGQLANIGVRNDRLRVPFRLGTLENGLLLTEMRIFPSRLPSDGE